ncbi:hypothetical protein TIFTF001_020888 [Ficus carica]|uniref:Wax synthase domain-containing protein n=1 Tax=Ficus carica TaxID=3494 RepID=A0AA88A9G9_FICCA|nr:hypothetical protein TIFTF001_020888 [Ficus carica]
MDEEIRSFIKVWSIAITCLCYCYYLSSRIPNGIKRLISLLPIFYLFIILPLDLHSFHLGAPTIFFLVWLGTFKLLLFSFDQGPLSPLPKNIFHFISISCLPIKITQNPPPKSPPKVENPKYMEIAKNPLYQKWEKVKPMTSPPSKSDSKVPKSVLMGIKVILSALIVKAYEYRPYLPTYITLLLYCCHLYLGIEIVLALSGLPARTLLGFELEPQFNEPYLTTSLQDFWGRRWNLMVSSILKPTAFQPARRLLSPILGPEWARLAAFVWAFTVSGLMHEAIYYYLTRARPTWEVTLFFVLHGVCTAAEVAAKKKFGGKWRPSGVVSGGLALGFLVVTGNWLFFPQLMRNGVHEKCIKEYSVMVDFVKKIVK